jgi:HAD superfamily hydrolase (TIGR01450 family)
MSDAAGADRRPWLPPSGGPILDRHDSLLLDLDGTVYRGHEVIRGVPRLLAVLRSRGLHPVFVTNNASRTPQQVSGYLESLGVACAPEEVVTSAQAGAAVLAAMVPAGTRVLAVGGDGLRAALYEVGLEPVEEATDVGAVAQGWAPDLAWPLLAEAAFALGAGVPWVATNVDLTLPTERGTAPGNGAFVGLLSAVTGRTPDRVAGKPEPPLLRQAAARFPGDAPLVVGDRLDTDILGASRVALPSLLVLTGVTSAGALLEAPPDRRPTFLASDLAGVREEHPGVDLVDHAWSCRSARAWVTPDGRLNVEGPTSQDATLDVLRAVCAAAWTAADSGRRWEPSARVRDLLQRTDDQVSS